MRKVFLFLWCSIIFSCRSTNETDEKAYKILKEQIDLFLEKEKIDAKNIDYQLIKEEYYNEKFECYQYNLEYFQTIEGLPVSIAYAFFSNNGEVKFLESKNINLWKKNIKIKNDKEIKNRMISIISRIIFFSFENEREIKGRLEKYSEYFMKEKDIDLSDYEKIYSVRKGEDFTLYNLEYQKVIGKDTAVVFFVRDETDDYFMNSNDYFAIHILGIPKEVLE